MAKKPKPKRPRQVVDPKLARAIGDEQMLRQLSKRISDLEFRMKLAEEGLTVLGVRG